ncbi:hypothetical protein QOT17_009349 [Balamuthia mandrillaris]
MTSSCLHRRLPRPKSLIELCLKYVAYNLNKFSKIVLPDELTLRLLQLLIEGKQLNDHTLLPFLHSNLRRLDISGCQDVNIGRIAKSCSNLRVLSLRGCLVINDVGMLEVAKSSPTLQTLNLSFNKKISDSGIQQITQVCTQLVELDLSWCNKLTDRTLFHLAKNCKHLRFLNCSNVRFFTGKGIKELGEGCKQLEFLELKGCARIESIELTSSRLKLLNLGGCSKILADSVQNINCPSLRHLNLSNCKRLTGISTSLPLHNHPCLLFYSLAPLLLRFSFSLSLILATDAAFESAKDTNGLARFPQLEELDVSYCNLSSKLFVSNSLRVLHLNGCTALKEDIFRLVGENCQLLTTINLSGCTSVTDECIWHLTKGCSKLLNVNLSRCCLISDASIKKVATNWALLHTIDLSWCPRLTDLAMEYLWKGCYFIDSIKIFGLPNVSSNAVYIMKQNLPNATVQCVTSDRDWCMFEALS